MLSRDSLLINQPINNFYNDAVNQQLLQQQLHQQQLHQQQLQQHQLLQQQQPFHCYVNNQTPNDYNMLEQPVYINTPQTPQQQHQFQQPQQIIYQPFQQQLVIPQQQIQQQLQPQLLQQQQKPIIILPNQNFTSDYNNTNFALVQHQNQHEQQQQQHLQNILQIQNSKKRSLEELKIQDNRDELQIKDNQENNNISNNTNTIKYSLKITESSIKSNTKSDISNQQNKTLKLDTSNVILKSFDNSTEIESKKQKLDSKVCANSSHVHSSVSQHFQTQSFHQQIQPQHQPHQQHHNQQSQQHQHQQHLQQQHPQQHLQQQQSKNRSKIIICKGLHNNSTETEVMQLFSPFGPVTGMFMDKSNNTVHVEMSECMSADKAVTFYTQRPPVVRGHVLKFSKSEAMSLSQLTPQKNPQNATTTTTLTYPETQLQQQRRPSLLSTMETSQRVFRVLENNHYPQHQQQLLQQQQFLIPQPQQQHLVIQQPQQQGYIVSNNFQQQHQQQPVILASGDVFQSSFAPVSDLVPMANQLDSKYLSAYTNPMMAYNNSVYGVATNNLLLTPKSFLPSLGSVLLVSNLNEEKVSPEALFVLFGVYGDVVKVKVMYNKKDTALIQFNDSFQAQTALLNLDKLKLWDKVLKVTPSKHTSVQTPKDGVVDAGLTKDFNGSPLHRFKKPHSKNFSNIFPPSSTLHLSNIPNTSKECLVKLFEEHGKVVGFKFFNNVVSANKDCKMSLMQMSSVQEAAHALMAMHNYQLAETTHLRVSFSKSFVLTEQQLEMQELQKLNLQQNGLKHNEKDQNEQRLKENKQCEEQQQQKDKTKLQEDKQQCKIQEKKLETADKINKNEEEENKKLKRSHEQDKMNQEDITTNKVYNTSDKSSKNILSSSSSSPSSCSSSSICLPSTLSSAPGDI